MSTDPPPGQPSVTVSSTTTTTISLSWSVPSGSVVDSYKVIWEGDGTRSSTITTGGSTSYTIRGLEEDSSYTITVTATNAAGSAPSYHITIVTEKEGEKYDIRRIELICNFYKQERCIILRAICCNVTCSSSDCSHCGRSHFRSSDTCYNSCRDSHYGGGSVEAPLWSACQDSSTVCAHFADTGQCYHHHQSVLLCAGSPSVHWMYQPAPMRLMS